MNMCERAVKIVLSGLLGLLLILTTACKEANDEDTAMTTTDEAYFKEPLQQRYEINPNENRVGIALYHTALNRSLKVNLESECDVNGVFQVPPHVIFDKGQNGAYIWITYDPAHVEYDRVYTLKVWVANDSVKSATRPSSYTFELVMPSWVDWGEGQLRDDLVGGFDGKNAHWNVTIQKSNLKQGVYRLLTPYGCSLSPYADQYNEEGLNTSMVIDASDPDFVYFKAFDSGVTLNASDGELSFISLVDYEIQFNGADLSTIKATHPEYFGQLKEGFISFDTPYSCLARLSAQGEGYIYRANVKGLLRIALPGTDIKDYQLSFSYQGQETDAYGNDFIVGNLTLGLHIEKVKYRMANSPEGAEQMVEDIGNGTIGAYEQNTGGTIQLPADTTGTYYVVLVGFADNQVVATSITSVDFKSSKDILEQWKEVATGTYSYGVQSLTSRGRSYYSGQSESKLYVSVSDSTRYCILPWASSKGDGLIFTWNHSTNILTANSVFTGENFIENVDEDYGPLLFSDLVSYNPNRYAAQVSQYDPSTGTFEFRCCYHFEGGWLGAVLETFIIQKP